MNNRVIKFRAWDGKGTHYGGFSIHATGDVFTDIVKPEKIMQFTGLTDKNGKEIYIGDILATWNKGGEGLDDWYVPDNGYTVVEEDPEELGIRYSNWAVEVGNRDSIYDIQFVEVIGNIYENPELLK